LTNGRAVQCYSDSLLTTADWRLTRRTSCYCASLQRTLWKRPMNEQPRQGGGRMLVRVDEEIESECWQQQSWLKQKKNEAKKAKIEQNRRQNPNPPSEKQANITRVRLLEHKNNESKFLCGHPAAIRRGHWAVNSEKWTTNDEHRSLNTGQW